MADLKISQLTALDGTLVAANDELPIVDSSASETKKVTPEGLVSAGIRLLPAGSIDFSKINGASVTIPDGSVTAAKLATNAVITASVVDGAITDAKIGGPISAGKFGAQAAGVVLAGPATGTSSAPTFRAIVPTDLPKGTAVAIGAVSVPAAGGLAVDANGGISLNAVVTAGSSPVVTYDAFGRITAGRALAASDLPLATASAVGAVKPGTGLSVDGTGSLSVGLTAAMLPIATGAVVGAVKPAADLTVAADGSLSIRNSVAAGTSTKVTYDAKGLITAGGALTAADIPNLDASKIVSGTLNGTHIANRSITQSKLADYAISYIQETQPSSVTADHPIGELWFQESTAKLSMWNGNSWMPVGQGALSGQNLRFCGTFDATTGQVKALTTFGTSDGFSIGVAIPAADNKHTGAYFVCDTAGSGTGVATGVTFDAGDWILCISQSRGWERIDTLSSGGGGGGGGASSLAGLTDTNITTPATGDVLYYTGTQWVNRQANADPGTYT
jgi:hypothetical protein